jgi:heme exporter protein A
LGHELALQPSLTLLEYCRWHPAILSVPSEEEALSVLKQVGLLSEAHRLCGQLSRGQGQRLLIACALLSKAPLWLFDEPLTALDIPSREVLMERLQAHRAQGGSALVVSHSSLAGLADGVIDVLA